MQLYKICNSRGTKRKDEVWTLARKVLEAQNNIQEKNEISPNIRGLRNDQNVSDFINATIQILFHSRTI